MLSLQNIIVKCKIPKNTNFDFKNRNLLLNEKKAIKTLEKYPSKYQLA